MPLYTVKLKDKTRHLIEVSVVVSADEGIIDSFYMPNWVPGSYMERGFVKHINTISSNATITREDIHSWKVSPYNGDLHITYEYWAQDHSVRGSYLDQNIWHSDGASLFLCFPQLIDKSHKLKFAHDVCKPVIRTFNMPKHGDVFEASSYHSFIDYPIFEAVGRVFEFDVLGKPHKLHITGADDANIDRLLKDVKKICEFEGGFFKEHPATNYNFLLRCLPGKYGGLEHLHGTSLICDPKSLPYEKNKDEYAELLSLFAHEYFHSWWVKSVKPVEFHQPNLKTPILTEQLWAFEGITSYYDELILVRAGLIDPEHYLKMLAKLITSQKRVNAHNIQSLKDSSIETWQKFYIPSANSPNAHISYYAKGALLALCLDMMIRSASKNEYSLDNVVLDLWSAYKLNGKLTTQQTFAQVIEQYGGVKVVEFLNDALISTKFLPVEECLSTVGINLSYRAATSVRDFGQTTLLPSIKAIMGVRIATAPQGVRLTHVLDGLPAQNAGLMPEDVLIALANQRVTEQNMQDVMDRIGAGSNVVAVYFRDDVLQQATVKLAQPALDTAVLTVESCGDDDKNQAYQSWLGLV